MEGPLRAALLTGRREDRLLFDHQIALAQMFGYEDATYTLAVEQFMQRYYRTAMDVSLLNEMLLQLFREAILADPDATAGAAQRALPGARRLPRGRRTTTSSTAIPSALLELFVCCSSTRSCAACARATIRLLRRHLWLIDEEFRQHPRNHRLFLEILRAPVGVTHELRRMNLYGVLGRYIPAFGRIVGRMQYDLFHAYTVDAHTLFVVSNLRRFALPKLRPRIPDAVAHHAGTAEAGARATSPRSSTTSPRAAAATTRSSAPWMRKPSASSRGCPATTRAWSPGWCATTWCFGHRAEEGHFSDPQVIRDFAQLRRRPGSISTTSTC